MCSSDLISQLAIGSDLQKSRVLYLPVLGLCLLFGERIRAVPAVLFLTAQLFFLEHNLTYWREVSLAVRQACQARTTEAIPNSIDGVYALANGRQECVEIVNAVPN
mgnify:FL=1